MNEKVKRHYDTVAKALNKMFFDRELTAKEILEGLKRLGQDIDDMIESLENV